jgi:tetratricopeptide (TPR) repeat protein
MVPRRTIVTDDEAKEELFVEAVDAFGDGRLDDAIRFYSQALEIDPGYQDALHGLARAQFDKGDMDGAINSAKRLTEIDGDDILAHTRLSMCYHSKGMIEEAEKAGNTARILGWKQDLKKG